MKRALSIPVAIGIGLAFFTVFLLVAGEPLPFKALWNMTQPYELDHRIIWALRFPRLLLAFGIGGCLAMLGAIYQVMFNNPLAEPYVLGISTAVTLGVVLAQFLWGVAAQSFTALGMGFLFSFFAIALIIGSYFWNSGKNLERIVLFGMGLNFVCSSLLFTIVSYQHQNSGSHSIKWLFGNIPWLEFDQVALLLSVILPICLFLLLLGRHLDGLSLGDSVARTLGYSPHHSRITLLILSSVLLSLISALTGAIGFVGLVVPHCIRLLLCPRSSRYLLSFSFLGGAFFLALSDCVSRSVIVPLEIPIGVVTTLLGGPVFLYLLWKK